jgi:Uma2 family endonuclease
MLPGHASTLRRIRGRLAEALDPSRYVLGSQEPVRLDQESEPEPDLWVAQAPAARYHDRHPSPADLALVVEVADTSLAFDQRVKLPRYARAGIPEVWLVSLPERVVHRYLGPSGDRYASHDALAGGRLSAVGVDLDVSELLPGA